MEQMFSGIGDFQHRRIERGLIRFRRLVKSADLADELKRGGGDFFASDGRRRAAEYFDAAAHKRTGFIILQD